MTARLLPHPVLLPDGSDYKRGTFDATITETHRTLDGQIRAAVKFSLESDFIQKLVRDGKARMCLVTQCARTYRREFHHAADMETMLCLSLADYADKIIVSPYIIATDPIKSFVSGEHDDEFKGMPISLPAGAILARGNDSELTLDSLHTLSAAIRLRTDNKLDEGEYRIDIDDDYINIIMHKKTREKVESVRKTAIGQLYPSLYMSALTHAIRNIEGNKDRKWAEALAKSLGQYGPASGDLNEKPYVYAQMLLQNPLERILAPQEKQDD